MQTKMITIKFRRKWSKFVAGSIAVFGERRALPLIEKGIAVETDEPPTTKKVFPSK